MSGVKLWRCVAGAWSHDYTEDDPEGLSFIEYEPGRWYPETEAAALEADHAIAEAARAIDTAVGYDAQHGAVAKLYDALDAARRAT